jgi:hypothetical protein
MLRAMVSRLSVLRVFAVLSLRAASGQVLSKSELDCDFEVDLCAFVSDSATYGGTAGWLRNSGPTATTVSGPNFDHTTGNGSYVYAEQKNNINTEFILDLDVGGPFPFDKVSFWYSMFGLHTTYLKFQSSVDGVVYTNLFAKFGQQTTSSTEWLFAEVNVTDRPHYFRFAQLGSNNKADTAIDDFQVNSLAPAATPQVGGCESYWRHL